MKGMRCRCTFATVATRTRCPRCGRPMSPHEWPDEGKVLSFTCLQITQAEHQGACDIALVGVHDGPKVICWASETLSEGDEVQIVQVEGKHFCYPKHRRKGVHRAVLSEADVRSLDQPEAGAEG